VFEIFGKHTVANPAKPDGEYYYIFDKGGTILRDVNVDLNKLVDVTDIKGKNRQFTLTVLCDINWVCYEEKRDVWFTAFYDMDLPEAFSAKPK
jgi:hypothetical protein